MLETQSFCYCKTIDIHQNPAFVANNLCEQSHNLDTRIICIT